jgi:uncharacterized glyoxalase superfamily metalloenzyme YdcJ
VGDDCRPAHDPAIDQTPPEVTFDELHAEYLREIASKLRAEAEVEQMRTGLAGVRQLVDQQAEDAGLWFFAKTADEAYVQQELRKLHAAIEALAREKANYV